jgi:hypothetical protein
LRTLVLPDWYDCLCCCIHTVSPWSGHHPSGQPLKLPPSAIRCPSHGTILGPKFP